MKLYVPRPTSQRTLFQRYGDNYSISVIWVTHLQPELKKYITDNAIYFQSMLYYIQNNFLLDEIKRALILTLQQLEFQSSSLTTTIFLFLVHAWKHGYLYSFAGLSSYHFYHTYIYISHFLSSSSEYSI